MTLFGPPDIEKLKAKNNITGLIKALSYKNDTNVHLEAVKALGQIGDAKATETLIAILDHEHESVRIEAVKALGQIGDAQAVVPLVALLKSKSTTICYAAVDALATIGAPAIKPLSSLLNNYYASVRENSILALGKIGDTRAVRPLISVLKSEKRDDRMAAIDALERIGWQPDKSVSGAIFWICKREWERCIEMGSVAIKPLINVIKDSDDMVRNAAVDVLVKIGDPSVEPLIAALKKKDRNIRKIAAEALGKIGKKSAVDPLIAKLDDKDGEVIVAAFDALNQIGWKSKIDIEKVNSWIANGYLDRLEKLDYNKIKPLLIKSLQSNSNWQTLGRVAAFLNKQGMKVSDPCLQKIIKELLRIERTPDEKDDILVPGERNDHIEEVITKSHADVRSLASSILREFKDRQEIVRMEWDKEQKARLLKPFYKKS